MKLFNSYSLETVLNVIRLGSFDEHAPVGGYLLCFELCVLQYLLKKSAELLTTKGN
jgi:hypothetical protein